MGIPVRATEPVYANDVNGVRRLVAAPGDAYDPEKVPVVGIVSAPDHPGALVQPWDGYDEMSEDEIVARLGDLSKDELAAVQAYERPRLARGTITRFGHQTRPVRRGRRKQADAMPAPDAVADTASVGETDPAAPAAKPARRKKSPDDGDE